MRTDSRKLKALRNMPPPKLKKELQTFLRIMNYFRKFSQMTAEVCKPLRQLTSVMTEWCQIIGTKTL